MARQTGPVFLQGTYGDICAYWCNGQWLFRQKSSLTGKRVKTSPRFRNTMLYAGLLKRGSMIASAVYAALPKYWKQFWMYRSFVGEAMGMLREGKNDEDVLAILWAIYVAEFDKEYREEEAFRHRWAKPAGAGCAGATCAVGSETCVESRVTGPERKAGATHGGRRMVVLADGRLVRLHGQKNRPAIKMAGRCVKNPTIHQPLYIIWA